MINLNVDIENEFDSWKIDIDNLKSKIAKIFDYYTSCEVIKENFCLKDYEYKMISFDILFCDSKKTHAINKDYRNKDYPANIITFAVFADSPDEERFVLEFEINLGEIIIALDKIVEDATTKEISKEDELMFMVSHGIMHLLGFDHQTEEDFEFVVSHQKEALKTVGINYDKI